MKSLPQPHLTTTALLILRVVLGVVFVANGWQKTFTDGFTETGRQFTEMGTPLPTLIGPAIGLLELIGGVLLIVGLATRVAAVLLAGDMLVALITVEAAGGLLAAETVLILAAAALTIALTGPGPISIDRLQPLRYPIIRTTTDH